MYVIHASSMGWKKVTIRIDVPERPALLSYGVRTDFVTTGCEPAQHANTDHDRVPTDRSFANLISEMIAIYDISIISPWYGD